MIRDWDRVELAYKALTKGEGNDSSTDATDQAIQASYDARKTLLMSSLYHLQ